MSSCEDGMRDSSTMTKKGHQDIRLCSNLQLAPYSTLLYPFATQRLSLDKKKIV